MTALSDRWEDAIHAMGESAAATRGWRWERTEAPMGRGRKARRLRSDGTPDFRLTSESGTVWHIEAKLHQSHHGAWKLGDGVKPEQAAFMERARERGEYGYVLLAWAPPYTDERDVGAMVWLLPWEGLRGRFLAHLAHREACQQRRRVKKATGISLPATEGPPPFALDELGAIAAQWWEMGGVHCPDFVPALLRGLHREAS